MQRKASLISGHSGIVISCDRFENGGSNGLEGSKGCRSVGGHGNQHVRLRSAQVSLSGVTCLVQEAIFAFELRQAPEGPNMQAERFSDFSKKFSTAFFHASRRRSIRLPRPCGCGYGRSGPPSENNPPTADSR
jgi:hypothetical protein